MKKRYLLPIALLLPFALSAQIVNIPDPNFKAALVANTEINTNGDDEIQVSEAEVFSGTIDVTSLGISDMTGIESFTQLTALFCENNNLDTLLLNYNRELTHILCGLNQLNYLDISINSKLIHLKCSFNGLANLDVSKNTLLQELDCSDNQLTIIDLANNPELERLSCYMNLLSELNLEQNKQLSYLNCNINELSSLDISSNTNLNSLFCSSNFIVELDISNNSSLTQLYCSGNRLSSLDVRNGNNSLIVDFDAANNPLLKCISVDDVDYATANWTDIDDGVMFSEDCGAEPVYIPDHNFKAALVANTEINTNGDGEIQVSEAEAFSGKMDVSGLGIADMTGLEAFIALTDLECLENSLVDLDVSANVKLERLFCRLNQLQRIDVTNNLSLRRLFCDQNSLESLDVTKNANLEVLNCSDNKIVSLDVSENLILTNLYCSRNFLGNIDVSNNKELLSLSVVNTNLTNIDVSVNTNLLNLNCDSNLISNLDLSNNTQLISLSCSNNSLSSLDLSFNTKLKDLFCLDNSFTNLDLSNNTALRPLICFNNLLEELDVSHNPNLSWLICNNNSLSYLDLSNNILLEELICYNNFITDLNLVNNTSLYSLICFNNLLNELDVRNDNNDKITIFEAYENPYLSCIEVSDMNFAYNNWKYIDDGVVFTEDCDNPVVYIPDPNFKAALVANTEINTNGDDEIQYSEAEAFSGEINVSGLDISEMTGLREFTKLTILDCSDNSLNQLDVSSNKDLVWLNCNSNQLSELDITNNLYLSGLFCYSNQISSLDVTNNLELTYLHCYSNLLEILNINANIKLTELYCGGNQLLDLDVSRNTLLKALFCENNKLKSLDLRNNESLEAAYCRDNELFSLDIRNSNNHLIQYVNTLNNSSLKCISVDDVGHVQSKSEVDPEVIFSTDGCNVYIPDPNFKAALVADSDINTNGDDEIQYSEAESYTGLIDVSGLGIADMTGIEAFLSLTELYCLNNTLSSLDVSSNLMLKKLGCSNNLLTNLDVSENISLTDLSCADNQISSLNVRSNTALTFLYCPNNQLSSLDLTGNPSLAWLYLSNNQLSNLDVSANTALGIFYCDSNQLSSIDLSTNLSLDYFYCSSNSLTILDVSNNIDLLTLDCHDNQLSALDIATNTKLEELYCSDNQISSLDLASNLVLTELICYNNQLETLDIRANSSLAKLLCSSNTLQSLDLRNGNKTKLTSFSARYNPDLSCISVDDVDYATANWTNLDEGVVFDLDCGFVADFTADSQTGYAPITVQFSDETVGSPISWSWDFDNDGLEDSDVQNPAFEYSTPGTYTVSLEVNNGSISKSAIKSSYIAVKQPVVASFSADVHSGTASLDIQFSDESQGDITSWQWDFGDGNTSSDEAPLHTYETEGIYTVSLIVGDGTMSDTKTITDYIEVLFNPEQTITFNSLPTFTYGDEPFSLDAVATSELPVSYSSSNTSVVTISGDKVTIVGAGSTIITATQPGDDVYNAAEPVEQELVVEKADQSITFAALDSKTYGDQEFELGATTTSGLTISYSSSDNEVATVSGSTVTIVGAGTVMITASQTGDDNFNTAEEVSVELIVNKASQIITFSEISDQFLKDSPLTLNATSTAELDVTYEIVQGPATVEGSLITFNEIGEVTVIATQSGNGNYLSADPVSRTFNIIAITGLDELISAGISCYPNPASNALTIEFNHDVETISLLNIKGQVLYENAMLHDLKGHLEIDVSDIQAGEYLVVFTNEKYQLSQKLMIVK